MQKNRRGRFPLLALLVALTLMTGCTTMIQNLPPVDVYTLDPGWSQSDPPQTEKKGSLIIRIAPVRAVGDFTSTDILYTDIRDSQHSYAYSRWRDTPLKAMQTVFEVVLGKSGLFKAVLPPTSVSGADLLLESTLLEFGHVLAEEGPSTGVVRMRFHLIDNRSRKVVAGKEMVARIPVATLDARGATAAINQAALRVGDDLVSWLGTVLQ